MKTPKSEDRKTDVPVHGEDYTLDWVQSARIDTFGVRAGPFLSRRVRAEDGSDTIWLSLRVSDQHLNSSGFCHGGVLLTLADEALGINAHTAVNFQPTPTVSLQAHFLKAVRPGELLEAYTTSVHATRTLVFAEGCAVVDGQRVAMMNAVFKIVKPKE